MTNIEFLVNYLKLGITLETRVPPIITGKAIGTSGLHTVQDITQRAGGGGCLTIL